MAKGERVTVLKSKLLKLINSRKTVCKHFTHGNCGYCHLKGKLCMTIKSIEARLPFDTLEEEDDE